jgi:hypothetical protein
MADNLIRVACGLATMTTPVMAATDDKGGTGLALGVIILAIYFIPAIVASNRRHRNRTAIGVLNLLLGWTLIGWVAALVWALTADVEPPKPGAYTTRWSRAKAAREQAKIEAERNAVEKTSQRTVFERDGAWYCVVDDKVYGAWTTRELALTGKLIRSHQ